MKMMTAIFASSDGCTPRPAKPQPPRRAVEARPEQDSHQRRADDGERGPDDRRLPVVPVVDAHDDRQDRQSHQRPGDLFDQEEVRRLEPFHRHHGRRAVDHDNAGTHEQQRGREEQLVRFELSRHTPPFNGHLKRSVAAAENLSCDRTCGPALASWCRRAAGSASREQSAVISPSMGEDTTLADRGSLRSQRMVLYRTAGADHRSLLTRRYSSSSSLAPLTAPGSRSSPLRASTSPA